MIEFLITVIVGALQVLFAMTVMATIGMVVMFIHYIIAYYRNRNKF